MRVLITGHLGYIGSVMAPTLRQAGHEVVGLDSGFFRTHPLGEVEEIPELKMDLRDVSPSDVDGFDAVIHLAGLSNDPLGWLDPGLTHRINFQGSVRLAMAAKQAGVKRFLFSSSCSMYGTGGDQAVDESAPLTPLTPYAETKVWFERALAAMADDEFTPVSLRNATAHGWSPRLRGDLVVHNLLGAAMSTGQVLIRSDGTPWRPLVHVEDIATAFLAALEAPQDVVWNQAFNVGSDAENYQVREIAAVIAQVVHGSVVSYAPGGEPDKRDYRVEFRRIGEALPSFKTKWTLEASVRDLHERFLEHEVTLETLEGWRCTRLRRILRLLEAGKLSSDLRWVAADGTAESVAGGKR